MPNDWDQSAKYVMEALDRNHEDHLRMEGALSDLRAATAALKVKAGVWGIFGGCLSGLLVLIYLVIKTH